MKFIWEPDDVRPCLGMIVEKPGAGEWWFLGYLSSDPKTYTMTSTRDGMTNVIGDKCEAAEHLNSGQMRPIVDRVQINAMGTRQPPRIGDVP